MARDDSAPPVELHEPQVRLGGTVDEAMLETPHSQLAAVDNDRDPITVELTTLGGGADYGRRAMLDIELARERLAPRLRRGESTRAWISGSSACRLATSSPMGSSTRGSQKSSSAMLES